MQPGRAGGVENLARSLLDHLLQLDRVNPYTLLAPGGVRPDFALHRHANVSFVAADAPWRTAWSAAASGLRRVLKRSVSLRRARPFGAEIGLSVAGYIHPDLSRLTNILVVPDLQHEYHPEFFSARELAARRRLSASSVRLAAHICAISEFTRQTLIERFALPDARVTTTHLAADSIFAPGSPARRSTRRILERYGLTPGAYLLFPANTWPHKNHAGAIAALRVLRETRGLDPLLVCTGSPRSAQRDVAAMIRDMRLDRRVRFLGYCPRGDMPALYEGAAALFFPSLFEGFGMPLLEAMLCDCPIVCGNVTAVPEIAGDAALYTDPRSPEALADAVSRVLTDGVLRQTLIQRGRRRARDFSWTRFTLAIMSELERARPARAR